MRARAGRARRRRRGAGDGGWRRRAAVDPARAGESSGRCNVVRRQRFRASVATRPHIFGDCRHRRGASPGKPNRATRGSAAPGSPVLPFRPPGLLIFTTSTARFPSAAPVDAVDAAPRWLTRTPSVDSSSPSSAPAPNVCCPTPPLPHKRIHRLGAFSSTSTGTPSSASSRPRARCTRQSCLYLRSPACQWPGSSSRRRSTVRMRWRRGRTGRMGSNTD